MSESVLPLSDLQRSVSLNLPNGCPRTDHVRRIDPRPALFSDVVSLLDDARGRLQTASADQCNS